MSQTPIADVPFPVQIITESNALGAAGSSVAKALTGSPGVTLTNQTDSPSQSDIRLRGFALSPIVGVPQGVSVFVDRIELIRGSVGVFGRNSLAGALNIVTRRGRERSVEMEIEGGFYGSFGRTDRRVALLYVRVPLPGGCGTAARVLADFRQSNDNITEPDALGLTDIRTLGSTAQVSYEPNDRLMATVGAEWTRNDVEIVIREIPNQAFPLIERATTKHLDTDYHGLGVLFENVRGPAVGVEPFLTPGHPRRLTAGMRIRLPG